MAAAKKYLANHGYVVFENAVTEDECKQVIRGH